MAQVGNDQASIAGANVNDTITRDDGTQVVLKKADIDYAKSVAAQRTAAATAAGTTPTMTGAATGAENNQAIGVMNAGLKEGQSLAPAHATAAAAIPPEQQRAAAEAAGVKNTNPALQPPPVEPPPTEPAAEEQPAAAADDPVAESKRLWQEYQNLVGQAKAAQQAYNQHYAANKAAIKAGGKQTDAAGKRVGGWGGGKSHIFSDERTKNIVAAVTHPYG